MSQQQPPRAFSMDPSLPGPPSRHFLIPFSRLPSHTTGSLEVVKTRGDVWCRCLISSLQVSRGTRNDSTFTAVHLGDATATLFSTVCGHHVRTLRPDQTLCASLLNAALHYTPEGMNALEGKRGCCMGFWLQPGGLDAALHRLITLGGSNPVVFLLEEGAPPLEGVLHSLLTASDSRDPPPTSYIVLLGDNEGLSKEQEAQVSSALTSSHTLIKVGLGGTELLASQCITIVHYLLDAALGPSDCTKPAYDPSDKYADKVRPCRVCRPDHPHLEEVPPA